MTTKYGHHTTQREVSFTFHEGHLLLAPSAHVAFLKDVQNMAKKGIEHEKDKLINKDAAAKEAYEGIADQFQEVINHVVDDLVFGHLEDKAPGLANIARVKVGTRDEFMAMPTEQQNQHINAVLRSGLKHLMLSSQQALAAVIFCMPTKLAGAVKLTFSMLESVIDKMRLAVMRPGQDSEPDAESVAMSEGEEWPEPELVSTGKQDIKIRFNGTHAFLSPDSYIGHFQALSPVLRRNVYESKAKFMAETGRNADIADDFVEFMLNDVLFGELEMKCEIISREVGIKIGSAEEFQAASAAAQAEMISDALNSGTHHLFKLSSESVDYATADDDDIRSIIPFGMVIIRNALARIKHSADISQAPNAPQH